jgi:4-amino-4-deoxy-L-arabinose transferase-like glycosyltransferase
MRGRFVGHFERSPRRWLRTDAWALALVFASFALGMALTWQRWGNPLYDCGREMNQPLRLLRGEWLYGDVSHLYGPLAPVVNAGLYRILGISLDTLRAGGALATLVILALIYWLARALTGRAEAALSAISVTWMCALWYGGDYILPYTYAAVYGVALSLLAMAAAVRSLRSGGIASFLAAGLLTALTLLTKTEMGLATLAGGLTCVVLASMPHWRETALRAGAFLVIALLPPVATYVWIASHVGWTALLEESHLLYQHLAPCIVEFNRQVFGLVHPLNSLLAMVAVALRVGLAASFLAWLAMRLHAADDRRTAGLLRVTGVFGVAVIASWPLARWDGDPYLAVPLLLLALIGFHGGRLWKRLRSQGHARGRAAVGLALAVFALASLARSVLRVRVGRPYRPYLMPVAIVVFTYMLCALLPALIRRTRARRFLRASVVGLLVCGVAAVGTTTVRRHRDQRPDALVTPRGVMMTTPLMQRGFTEAVAFIEQHTRRDDLVAVFPEGTSVLFFTDRRNPLHEEITVPGFLYEERAIRTLAEKPVALVLIVSRSTREYGAARFGRDYAGRLMRWIEERFVRCGRLGTGGTAEGDGGEASFEAYCAPRTIVGAAPGGRSARQ